MKKYFYFLLISYCVTFLFELNANLNFDGKLFQVPGWPIVFLTWYGLFYSIIFFIFKSKPLWFPVVAGAILGTIAEAFLFHRLNIIVDPVIYAIMFFVPFWIYHKYIEKKIAS